MFGARGRGAGGQERKRPQPFYSLAERTQPNGVETERADRKWLLFCGTMAERHGAAVAGVCTITGIQQRNSLTNRFSVSPLTFKIPKRERGKYLDL